ncbi:MAG TPA: ABC transporter permease [Blastocatellia bacterium]|nr:ABC transporter permease [Blastocatellia bacterium]
MLKNYIKIAFKVLRRRKFFTFISLFAISFTLVVLMVVTAIFDHSFGPLAPETRADRTLGVFSFKLRGKLGTKSGSAGYLFLDRYVRTLPDVERVSVFSTSSPVAAYQTGEKVPLNLRYTDGNYWKILDFSFIEGGPLTDEDDRNANPVVVINEATRGKLFGGQPAVGKTLEINNQRFRVAGVVRNVSAGRFVPFSDVWAPIGAQKSDAYKTQIFGGFDAIILARSSDDFPAIKAEFASRVAQMEVPDPQFNEVVCRAETYFESVSRQMFGGDDGGRPAFLIGIIMLGMALFMLLPAVNLVNINVSRIMERASEIGVRKAFGASSWTLVGQFVVENVILTLVGGLIGFLIAWGVLRVITANDLIQYADLHMNFRVFIYGMGLALFFGLVSGVYPAWRMSRLNPVQALKGASR